MIRKFNCWAWCLTGAAASMVPKPLPNYPKSLRSLASSDKFKTLSQLKSWKVSQSAKKALFVDVVQCMSYPILAMYGINFMVNAGKYTIHGCYGYWLLKIFYTITTKKPWRLSLQMAPHLVVHPCSSRTSLPTSHGWYYWKSPSCSTGHSVFPLPSGQIAIIPKPELRGFWGVDSLLKPRFI